VSTSSSEGRLPGEANVETGGMWVDIVPSSQQARGSGDTPPRTVEPSRSRLQLQPSFITEVSHAEENNMEGMPTQAISTQSASISVNSDHVNAKVPKSYVEEILRSLSSIESGSYVRTKSGLGGFKERARALVRHQYFDYAVCAVIALNAASIGVQTDYVAQHHTDNLPSSHRAVDITFCVLFTAELLLRLYVHGLRFFYQHGWQWNYFDAALVLQQLVEEVLTLTQQSSDIINLSFARVLRILRLVRVMRLVRILRLIRELRMLVTSISSSLKSLGWTILLLILLIYTVSLYLTQMVTERIMTHNPDIYNEHIDNLNLFYGSVLRTMLSLFESVSGGVDWDVLVRPLSEEISPLVAVVLTLYIAFTTLAMLNVVTGVFVESVLLSAKMDKDHMLVSNARELFKAVHGDAMSLEFFESKVDTKEMQEFFRGIDVDPSEARGIFRLLDIDNDGEVDAEEFLSGCIRLRGPAKALETATLIHEVRKLHDRCADVTPWSAGHHEESVHTLSTQPHNEPLVVSSSPSYCSKFLAN